MLRLSEELGQAVWDADGARFGTLVDLAIADGDDRPEVLHLVVGVDGRRVTLPWRDVASFEHGRVELCSSVVRPDGGDPSSLGPHELRLDRDVLDAQIVDLRGHRLVRCGDVLLT